MACIFLLSEFVVKTYAFITCKYIKEIEKTISAKNVSFFFLPHSIKGPERLVLFKKKMDKLKYEKQPNICQMCKNIC